ncbi:MAG TPA: hypothetical protein VGD46_18760 [Rhizobacter sp.]
MHQDHSGYYGHISTNEKHADILQRHGVTLGPYDAASYRFPAHVKGAAYDALVHVAAQQPGTFTLSMVYRHPAKLRLDRTPDQLDAETLRGELALSRFRQAVDSDPDYWTTRAAQCERAYDAALATCGTLARLAAEGEIEITTGYFGTPDAPEDMVTVRVYFDRDYKSHPNRAMVIERLWPTAQLEELLGAEAARRVQVQLATDTLNSNAVSLQGDAVPLYGALAERVLAREWDPNLARNFPTLDLLSIGDAMALAAHRLEFPQPAMRDAVARTRHALWEASRSLVHESYFSLAELARYAPLLIEAREQLRSQASVEAKWVGARLDHLLNARTPLRLIAQPTRGHKFVSRDYRYVIAHHVPYAAEVPGTDMGEQLARTSYWGIDSWKPTQREATTFGLHEAEQELRRLLPRCPTAHLVPAEPPAPRPVRRMATSADFAL